MVIKFVHQKILNYLSIQLKPKRKKSSSLKACEPIIRRDDFDSKINGDPKIVQS